MMRLRLNAGRRMGRCSCRAPLFDSVARRGTQMRAFSVLCVLSRNIHFFFTKPILETSAGATRARLESVRA